MAKINLMLTSSRKTAPTRSVRQTIELLQQETLKLIPVDLWPKNSPDVNPVDCQIPCVMQDHVSDGVEDVAGLTLD